MAVVQVQKGVEGARGVGLACGGCELGQIKTQLHRKSVIPCVCFAEKKIVEIVWLKRSSGPTGNSPRARLREVIG